MLGQAIAHLHWAPETFWKSTPHEFFAACEASGDAQKEARKSRRQNSNEPSDTFKALRDGWLAKHPGGVVPA